MKKELPAGTKTVLTGGQSEIFKKMIRVVDYYDEDLTLKGLKIIYLMNVNEKRK